MTARRTETPTRPLPAIALLLVVAGVGAGAFVALRGAGQKDEPRTEVAGPDDGVEREPIPSAVEPAPPPWDGTSPLRCTGDESHVLKAKTVTLAEDGIRAEGRCRVTLEDCRFEGAIRVEGDAQVVVKGGTVSGDVRALARGRLSLENVAVEGSLRLDDDASLEMRGGRIDTRSAFEGALRTGGKTSASLSEVAVVGTIDARDDSLVELDGGVIGGAEQEAPIPREAYAIRVDHRAAVTLRNTRTERGGVSRHGAGVVVELAEGDDASARIAVERERAEKIARYQRMGCAGFVECFVENRSFGTIDLQVTTPIAPDGRAKAPRVTRALGANPAARACLQKVASERLLVDFDGPPGALECSLSGTITQGARMLSISQVYRPDEP